MYCNQGFKNLIYSSKINNRYLFWFLKGNTEYLNSLGRGATFKEISKQIVSSIEINVPEIEEQEKNEAPEKFLHRLEQKMHQIQNEQNYYMDRHNELLHTETSNARRIIWFHVLQIIVVCSFGYLQLNQFVKFLKLRKII